MNQFWSNVSRRRFLALSSGALLGSTLIKGCSNTPSSNSSASPGETGGGELLHQDETALYEAAKKEGKLVYYTVFFNQDVVNEIGAAFTKKYPGIQFEGTRKVAGTLFQQLSQEIQSGIKTCDVFGTTDVGQMLKLKGGQKLLTYEPYGVHTSPPRAVFHPMKIASKRLRPFTKVGIPGGL
jgi:iron(III) transport system substrate-binding protein